MPKRKSNLSKIMRKAKSQRLRRENESVQDRERRLKNCRLRMSMSRSKESSSKRNERLQLDRTRHSLLRAQKSLKNREHRLENDRIQHVQHYIKTEIEANDENIIRQCQLIKEEPLINNEDWDEKQPGAGENVLKFECTESGLQGTDGYVIIKTEKLSQLAQGIDEAPPTTCTKLLKSCRCKKS